MLNNIIRVQVIRGHKLLAVAVRLGKRTPFCFGYAPTQAAQNQLRYRLEADATWYA